jgi:hypothetical protein
LLSITRKVQNFDKVFARGKALGQKLYSNNDHTQLRLMQAFISIESEAKGFIHHIMALTLNDNQV